MAQAGVPGYAPPPAQFGEWVATEHINRLTGGAYRVFVPFDPPAPLPWHVRHPNWAALIAALAVAAFVIAVR